MATWKLRPHGGHVEVEVLPFHVPDLRFVGIDSQTSKDLQLQSKLFREM
jgi:hypothetical protein